jgi:hypothetical protein
MDAKDSREQAKRCLEFASTVKNGCIQALLFDIARAWLSLSYALEFNEDELNSITLMESPALCVADAGQAQTEGVAG